ncbi:response regulator [Burkholderiaceae bacterium DAT-1]|nr:response regulator [Burkholderiaceae bacterium DAT-1]
MRKAVLIVDDDIYVYAILKAVLEHDFEVRYARSGDDAMEAVSRSKPDVVLLDIEMSGMDGYDVCRLIKGGSDPEPPSVIFVSAHSEAEERLAAYAAGADDFIVKPLNVEEVYTKVAQTLEARNEIETLRLSAREALETAKHALGGDVESREQALRAVSKIVEASAAEQIAQAMLNAMSSAGLEGVVQIRGQNDFTMNSAGKRSTMEAVLLQGLSAPGTPKISTYGSRTSITQGCVSLMIKNMPEDAPERSEAIQSQFCTMVDVADLRASALNNGPQDDLLQALREVSDDLFVQLQRQQSTRSDALADIREHLEAELRQVGFLGSQAPVFNSLLQQLLTVEKGDGGQLLFGARQKLTTAIAALTREAPPAP